MNDETQKQGWRFVIDAAQGSFIAQAFAGGLLSFAGHNPNFAVRKYGGEIQFSSDRQKVNSLAVVIRAESLQLIDDVSDKDRAEIEKTMREEVLETTKFPEIVFASKDISMRETESGIFAVTVKGVLILHGAEQWQTIEAEAEINDDSIHAVGEFWLRQGDFNIKQVKALGGTLKVKDDVRIEFDIIAKI